MGSAMILDISIINILYFKYEKEFLSKKFVQNNSNFLTIFQIKFIYIHKIIINPDQKRNAQ